jgi:molybdopterin-guanine dinucleotide biosynthesis protein A
MGSDTLGAVLAGGRGSRLGGAKAAVELGGRPLIAYPLAALAAAGIEAVVCAKAGKDPPPLTSRGSFRTHIVRKEPRNEVPVLEEPDEPRHPLCGIVTALRVGEGPGGVATRPVIAVACDMPFVAPELLAFLAEVDDPLVVPVVDDRLHPLLGRYAPALLPELEAALKREEPLTRTVKSLNPRLLGEEELARFGDPRRLLFNVNDPADLREAESLIGG